jgi:hypothetical protein
LPETVTLRNEGETISVGKARNLEPSSEIEGSITLYRMTADRVTMQLDAEAMQGDVTEMLLWTDDMTEATWQPFATHVELLASDEIYARFRDEFDNVSQLVGTTRYPTTSPPPQPAFDAVTLASLPEEIDLSIGETLDVPIWVYADTLSVDSAGAYLNFDETVLEVVSITPGDELPLELKNEFDNSAGHADFVGGTVDDFPSGTFKLATVTFEANCGGG